MSSASEARCKTVFVVVVLQCALSATDADPPRSDFRETRGDKIFGLSIISYLSINRYVAKITQTK